MPTQLIKLDDLSPADRKRAIDDAALALREGRPVVLPTESVYGLAFALTGDGFAAIDAALHADGVEGAVPRYTWHAPDLAAVIATLALEAPVHRRLLSVLLARPVRFEIEMGAEGAARVVGLLALEPGRIDAGGVVAVRRPSSRITREVLSLAGVPVAMVRLSTAGLVSESNVGRELSELRDDPARPALSPAMVFDDGPTVYGEPSTTVRLREGGAFEVASVGAVSERDVLQALKRRIVFVCTGNTCRSPMAEAIARQVIASGKPSGLETIAASAGVAADPGSPASPEAVDAMRERGLDLSAHRSRALTGEEIDRADLVLAMTESHAEVARQFRPNASHKILTLDPAGDIPDPIGGPLSMYRETADRIESAIRQRLREIEA